MVERIDLPSRPDQKVTVVMSLERSTGDIIKKDSVASIKTEGLLGNKYVEISFGSMEADKVKDGDGIGSEPPLELSDLIKKTDQILESTRDTMGNVAETTGHLKAVSSKINEGKGTVGALLNDKKIYREATEATAHANAAAAAFQENMEALRRNFLLRGFFKRRGYEDSSRLEMHEISRLPKEPSLTKFAYDGKDVFDKPDTAKLKKQTRLSEAGRFLEGNDFSLAVVVASCGLKGDTDKHRVLTKARAMVVRDFLAQNFRLDDTKIRTMGVGETRGVGDSGRVEIVVYPVGTYTAATERRYSSVSR
jgi:hypothetical protein